MNRQIYLHIGGAKTGTTALQTFLAKNRPALGTKGFGYPGTADAHWGICTNLREHTIDGIRARPHAFIQRCLREIQKSPYHTHIMSAECLAGSGNAAMLRELIPRSLPVTVVYYARRQDNLIESWYNQVVKSSQYRISERLDKEYLPTIYLMKLFNHRRVIDTWADAFGHENVIVRCYEKQQMNGDIIEDFSSVTGLALDDTFRRPAAEINVSMDHQHLEFIRLCNGGIRDAPEINDLFIDCGFSKSRIFSNLPRRHLLPSSLRLAILDHYEESNRGIAREYLGRPDGRLFFDPLPDPEEPCGPYPELSVPEAALILEELIRGLDQRQRDMEPLSGILAVLNALLAGGALLVPDALKKRLGAKASGPYGR